MTKSSYSYVPSVWAGVGEKRSRGLRILPQSGGYYVHVTSRAVGQAFLFGQEEKRKFYSLMGQWAEFSGLGVLTHCLMDNHVHMLLWVPPRELLSHKEILKRLLRVWPQQRVEEWEAYYQAHSEDVQARLDDAVLERMGNLPEFMRVLKQSFSRWYNQKNDRRGALWDSRYRSVVVEANPLALMSVGAYIDLNPVRAGICEDPADYHWSGYGSACGGNLSSRRGLKELITLSRGFLPEAALSVRKHQLNKELHWQKIGSVLKEEQEQRASPQQWKEVQGAYRVWVYHKGTSHADNPYAKTKFRERKGFDPVKVVAEFEKMGQVPLSDVLSRKLRYFTRGVAVGSPQFLEELMHQYRGCFGPKRKVASRKAKGMSWAGLGIMRQVD
jgi:REP element-mobilizing transposase RayT